MDHDDPLCPATVQFPLGVRFGDERRSPTAGGSLVPFGSRVAVTPRLTPVDLAGFSFDPNRQIGVVKDNDVLVPLMKHSTGETRTNTAPRDKAPGDIDTDYTED